MFDDSRIPSHPSHTTIIIDDSSQQPKSTKGKPSDDDADKSIAEATPQGITTPARAGGSGGSLGRSKSDPSFASSSSSSKISLGGGRTTDSSASSASDLPPSPPSYALLPLNGSNGRASPPPISHTVPPSLAMAEMRMYVFFDLQLGIKEEKIKEWRTPEEDEAIPLAPLVQLYQRQESLWPTWDRLAKLALKALQTPIWLATRHYPQGQIIPLHRTWQFKFFSATQTFYQALLGLSLETAAVYCYSLLSANIVLSIRDASFSSFNDFLNIYRFANTRGAQSLANLLVRNLSPSELNFILYAPLTISAALALFKFYRAELSTPEKIKALVKSLESYLDNPDGETLGFFRQGLELVLMGNFDALSLRSRLQTLTRWINCDAHLTPKDRISALKIIQRMANETHKLIQRAAIQSLSDIVGSVSLVDLPHLSKRHTPPISTSIQDDEKTEALLLSKDPKEQDILTQLYVRSSALSTLQDLEAKTHAPGDGFFSRFSALPRRYDSAEVLWRHGQMPSRALALLFFLLATHGIYARIAFAIDIFSSILRAIACPFSTGFSYMGGYQPWAGSYTPTCLVGVLRAFRSFNPEDSASALAAQIDSEWATGSLYGMTDLDLSSKYLTPEEFVTIMKPIVAKGAKITTLNLYGNQFANLTAGIFDNLVYLESLNLYGNLITYIGPSTFANNLKLLSLDLSQQGVFNELTMDGDSLVGLKNLQTLSFSAAGLTTLPDSIFRDLVQLQTLDLSINFLTTIPTALRQVSCLQSLNLADNFIQNIPAGTFDHFIYLQTLNIAETYLSSLHGILNQLSELRTLYVGANYFQNVTAETFAGLGKLETLDLSSCPDLTQFDVNIFQVLNQLQTFNFGWNQHLASSDRENLISHLPLTITSLDLTRNQLIQFPNISGLPALTSLNLNRNYISSLPINFNTTFINLQAIDLSQNPLIPSVLSKEFMQQFPSNLRNLTLIAKKITDIEEDTFSSSSTLEYLSLESSSIVKFTPGMLRGLSNLRVLDISNGQLGELSDGAFDGLPLEEVNLGGSLQLTRITSSVFAGQKQLKILELQVSNISLIDEGAFSDLENLESLVMWENQLSDESIYNLTTRWNPSQLITLALSENNITSVGAQRLASFWLCAPNLITFIFGGNPANDTAVIQQFQQTQLQRMCQTTACHANLDPVAATCSIPQSSDMQLVTTKKAVFAEDEKAEIDYDEDFIFDESLLTRDFISSSPLQRYIPESALTSRSVLGGSSPALIGCTEIARFDSTPIIIGVVGLVAAVYILKRPLTKVAKAAHAGISFCFQLMQSTAATKKSAPLSRTSQSSHSSSFFMTIRNSLCSSRALAADQDHYFDLELSPPPKSPPSLPAAARLH